MRILHVLPAFTKGGAEKVVVHLANQAVGAGHDVAVVAGFDVDPRLLLDGLRPEVEVRYVAKSGTGRIGQYSRLIPWLLRHRTWVNDYDVVHCHLAFGAVFGSLVRIMRRLNRRGRPAVVETYHAVGMTIPRLDRALHTRMMRDRDAVALMATDAYWDAFVQRYPSLHAEFIPNGVPTEPEPVSAAESEVYSREVGLPAGHHLVVGSVGRLVPARRPELLLDVFAAIARRSPDDVHFFLGGDGSELPALQARVRELGLEGRVHLPGLVMRPGVAFSLIDLYLTVNVGAVTGVAALEASISGLPIVAVQLRDDYIAPDEDWIWSSSDTEAVGARAAALLASAEARQALAERQLRHVRSSYSVEAMAQRYEALYSAARAAADGGKPR